MANSKSNIYPIQLQGAELCLNRYDAEIKQYSGFNKNNSPFVGGCLSNIFTKDEVIEGATKDSVYIAPNGDIWRVDNTGLYKNDTLILKKEGKCYDRIEVDLPSNIVCLYNEEVYITKEQSNTENLYGYYIFHCGDYKDVIIPYKVEGTSIANYHYNPSCDIEHIYIEGVGEVYCVAFQTTQSGSLGLLSMYLYTKDNENNIVKDFFYRVDTVRVTGAPNDTLPKVCIFPLTVETAYNLPGFFISGGYKLKIGLMYSSYLSRWVQELAFGSNNEKYDYTFYKRNYYGKIICGKSNFTDNYATTEVTKIYYYGTNEIRCDMVNRDETRVTSGNTIKEDYNTLKTQYGSLSILKRDVDGSYSYLGVCDQGFSVPSKQDDNKIAINVGCTIGGIFLLNNNLVSGLSLGSSVLMTEWNTVDPKGDLVFFFYDRQELYYQNITNNKWYKIYEGSPKLSLKYNQIVTNFNQIRNAYSLTKQKIVLFASAFNNRSVQPTTSTTTRSFQSIQNNNRYVAYCINEYNLEDNASIILNPVPVMGQDSQPTTYGIMQLRDEVYIDHYYNIYPSTEVKYQFSKTNTNNFFLDTQAVENGYVFREETLLDLPFPSDTNGNVAYSPSLFAQFFSSFGNDVFVREGTNSYQLSRYDNQPIMSFYLGTLIEGLTDVFILQGQYYGIINNQIFALQFYNGAVASQTSVVSVLGLQFCGNTPYEALFFSRTNRCLYSFTGANVLSTKQFIDKIDVVKGYKYNPATQSIFLLTDIGVIVSSLFGIYQIEMPEAEDLFLLDNGIVLTDNLGNYRYVRYYKEDTDDTYLKHNIKLETCFYGMNNQTVTINDCLYMRIFSEEHEQGNLEVSATTLSLEGRKTEKTVFRIKASDWDKETNTIYLRYQPKEQRGLGISFSINSPFKIAALSVGSQADAILVDKVSKGAINAPSVTSNNFEW